MINKFKIVNMGNFLDFLEFSLFSSLLPLITKDLIGNHNSSQKATLAYLLFYIGFMGRPLGALIFGYFGDALGRRKSLILSLTGMSLTSLLFGIIPNFSYAYIMIVIIRFAQGFFTGGEYVNATVYVLENAPSKNRFKTVANLTASGIFGASLGQMFGMVVSSDAIPFLNWRAVFILISIISIYVAMMRTYHITETIIPKQHINYNNIKKFLYSRYVVMGIIFGAVMNGLFYLIYTFIGTYSSIITGKFVFSSYLISLISSLTMGGFLIFWSRLSIINRYNSSQFIKISLAIMIIILYPLYTEFLTGRIGFYSIILTIVFLAAMQLFALVAIKSIPENLPAHCRVLLSGLSESIGGSLIGGAAPYISAELINSTGNINMPVWYFIGLMLIAFLLVTIWPLKNGTENISVE